MKVAATSPVKPATTNQSLAPKKTTDPIVAYKGASGADVQLSVALTKKYFCPNATDAEAYVFNEWCKHVGLDPWKKECFMVKFGNNPPQMLTSKDTFTKRAESNPKYRGQKAGVVVINNNGQLENRLGELVLDGEQIVGGWADVYVDNYVEPISAVVSFRERCQFKDGKPIAKWATSPALMIRKCALVAALREAFPSDVGGMYVPDEMGYTEEDTAVPITPPNASATDAEYVPIDETTGEVMDGGIDSLFGGNNA